MCDGQFQFKYYKDSYNNNYSYITRPDGNGALALGVGDVHALVIDGGAVSGGHVVNRIGALSYFTANQGLDVYGRLRIQYEFNGDDQFLDNVADFVIESKYSGDWFYIKFAQGMCVAIAQQTIVASTNTEWNNLFYDSTEKGSIAYPFTIYNPSPTVTIHSSNGDYWPIYVSGYGTSSFPAWYFVSAKSHENVETYCRYLVVGQWRVKN